MAISDLRGVDWGATAKVAVARGFASALVLTVLGALLGVYAGPTGGGAGDAFRFLIVWTFGAAIGGILYIYMLRAIGATLGRAVGIVGTITSLMEYVVVLLVALGDPLLFALDRRFPQLLAVEGFRPFNFVPVMFVRTDADRDPGFDID